MPDPWSESPPVAGIPASSGAGIGTDPNAFLRFMQAYAQMQQMRDRGAGIASGARAGIPMGVPLPQGVPTGGAGQQPQAAQGQAAGPVPSGSGGSGFQAQAPPVQPAMQVPYAGTGKGAWAANAIYGVSNMIAAQRQKDQQKESTQAENLWTQVLGLQQNIQNAANQGMDDPEDKARLQAIIEDDKNRKMIQDTLGTLTIQPGQQQQQQQDPKKQAQSSGTRNAFQKFGKAIEGAFDPRTAAQRMPAGGRTPINTPGGAQWGFPTPSPQQRAAVLTPEEARRKALIDAKLEPTAAQTQAHQIAAMQAQTAARREQDYSRYLGLWEKAKDDDYKAKMAAVAVRSAAARANQDPALIQSYHDQIENRSMSIKDVPAPQRGAVTQSFAGQQMPNPFNAKDLEEWHNLNIARDYLDKTKKDLAELQRLDPSLFDEADKPSWFESGLKKGEDLAETVANHYQYTHHITPGVGELGKAWGAYLEDLGFLRAQGYQIFSNIGRGKWQQAQIGEHLPNSGDTPLLTLNQRLPFLGPLTENRMKWLDDTNRRYIPATPDVANQQKQATGAPTTPPKSLGEFLQGVGNDTTIPYIPVAPEQ